jgi:hypothetical protein
VNTLTLQEQARAYYRLVAEARALNVPVSLDDPRSPKTVQGLRDAVAEAKS